MGDETLQIFKGCSDNLDELFELAEMFWHESDYNNGKMTLRPDRWKEVVKSHIDLNDTAAICARVDGKIVGYCLIYYQQDYTEEPVGEVFQFYVHPDYRKTNVARKIIENVMDQYEKWGCARAYCEASPGLDMRDHLSLFANLWGKFGYKKTGITLMKEF